MPTEIEELLEAATRYLKQWKKPSNEPPQYPPERTWQQIMDERLYKGHG